MFLIYPNLMISGANQTAVVSLGDDNHCVGDPRLQSRVFLLCEIKTTTASSSLISGVATYPDENFYPVRPMSFFSRFCLSRDRH